MKKHFPVPPAAPFFSVKFGKVDKYFINRVPEFGGWTPWSSMFSGVADIFLVLGGPASDVRVQGFMVQCVEVLVLGVLGFGGLWFSVHRSGFRGMCVQGLGFRDRD
jgi:hypothetical protein